MSRTKEVTPLLPRFDLHFGDLPDPRRDNGQLRHLLTDILAIALCATLSGAEGFVGMEEYGQAKQQWLRHRLGLSLESGVPSHDTFARVFAHLDPVAFEECFMSWTRELHAGLAHQQADSQAHSQADSDKARPHEVLCVDGKTLRRSFDTATGKKALHLVSAWCNASGLILAQEAVDDKSNEMTAVPALLSRLDLQGCIVTSDALNTQKSIAAQIVEQGGQYVLALKGNHGLLYQDATSYFEWLSTRPGGLAGQCEGSWSTREWGHGRHEVRRCHVLQVNLLDWPQASAQWPSLSSLVCIESARNSTVHGPEIEGAEAAEGAEGAKAAEAASATWPSWERRFYLSSLECDAPRLGHAVRAHWGIENGLHWVLDVAFSEDECRIRTDHAAHNMATLRRLALNLLKQEEQNKRGVKTKRQRAGWDDNYLFKVITAF